MNLVRDGLGARRVLGHMRLFGDVRGRLWNSTSNAGGRKNLPLISIRKAA